MTMSLTVFDLTLIGATTGLTTFVAMYSTMRLMNRFNRKRKTLVMEEMLSQMHDQAKTHTEFEQIVDQLRNRKGGFDE